MSAGRKAIGISATPSEQDERRRKKEIVQK